MIFCVCLSRMRSKSHSYDCDKTFVSCCVDAHKRWWCILLYCLFQRHWVHNKINISNKSKTPIWMTIEYIHLLHDKFISLLYIIKKSQALIRYLTFMNNQMIWIDLSKNIPENVGLQLKKHAFILYLKFNNTKIPYCIPNFKMANFGTYQAKFS